MVPETTFGATILAPAMNRAGKSSGANIACTLVLYIRGKSRPPTEVGQFDRIPRVPPRYAAAWIRYNNMFTNHAFENLGLTTALYIAHSIRDAIVLSTRKLKKDVRR